MNARAVAWLFFYWLALVCCTMPAWLAWAYVAFMGVEVFACARRARIKL